MSIELRVPAVGESVTEALIVEWLVSEGDSVELDENVAVIETDKANLEIPSPAAGILTKILKQKDEWVKVGEVIATLEEGNGSAKKKKEEFERKKTQEKKTETPPPVSSKEEAREETPASSMPAARRLLEEQGLVPDQIEGTGKGGRILKEDVLRHLEKADPPSKKVADPPDPDKQNESEATHDSISGREEEVVSMSPLRRSVAKRLVEAQQTAALLTTFNEVDMSAVMELRKQCGETFKERYGVKLGFMSFFVKAAVEALKRIPQVNAEIRDQDIVYHNYYDIGIAVSGRKGLLVPVLRNAERMSFAEIEKKILDFAQRAQDLKIGLDELEGGTFTISNGGVFGSLLSTPIVNPPQSGVLGLHAIQDRPIALNGEVAIRPMMYIALTYDHRLVDGREAVTFLRHLKECMEQPSRMLLEI